MKKKHHSVFYTLFFSISLTIFIAIFIVTKLFYSHTKENLLNNINNIAHTTIVQLENSIYPFMDSYSINEYENLIANAMNHQGILAILVEDYNMEKIVGSKYLVGKIKNKQRLEDYEVTNLRHQKSLDSSYLQLEGKIENQDGLELGKIIIYASDKIVQEKLTELIQISIIFALLSTIIILLVIFFVIKQIVQKPLDDIIKLISNKTDDGIPTQKIPSYNSKELAILSSTLNNMIDSIKESRYKLNQNIAFLKSYQLALDKSSIVTKANCKGFITYANDNFYDISGFSKGEVIGHSHSFLRHKETSRELYNELWRTINNKKVWKGVLRNKGKKEDYWVDTTILPILDENQNIVEFIAIRHDITKMILQQKQLDFIAKTDTLTGLGNRYKLINDIEKSSKPALAIINIDNFSESNDFYGYIVGDEIIKQIGLTISSLNDDPDTYTYHLQGDEYVLFNRNIEPDKFQIFIHELINKLTLRTIEVNEESLNFNFTTGISFENKNFILSTADMALKIAKRNNDNIQIFTQDISLNKEYENNIYWTKKIKMAIKNDNFVPVYQAIVNNKTKKIEKYESLVRLQDADRLISPFYFLEISKKTKHYTTITKTMIQKSFEQFKDSTLMFSVNLTINDILNKDIEKYIYEMLNQYNISSRVVFEIVESESIENFEAVLQFINNIKKRGCKIAIDDFGTGYSNFEYLMKLNTDYIKIDGSLIKEIDTNLHAQIVVSTIVDFAKKMNIKTIAEFVENESIFTKVIELDIDYSQGYFFSEPKITI